MRHLLLLAASLLIVAAAIVYHAGAGRYVLHTINHSGSLSAYDTRTGLIVRCSEEHGCETGSERRRRIVEAAEQRENRQ